MLYVGISINLLITPLSSAIPEIISFSSFKLQIDPQKRDSSTLSACIKKLDIMN